MISINNITISYSGITLLDEISFVLSPKSRVGLTGKNGAGKSTLLKIIAKEIEADQGQISMPGEFTIGYLPQQMIYPVGKSVKNEALTAFSHILELKQNLENINLELSQRHDYESDEYTKLIEKSTRILEHYNLSGGETIAGDTEKMLKGLGFTDSDFDREVSEFSGGWRMRIELAKILLKRPDLLLLDEPTNHLDIESIQWLEDFLKEYSGSIILISHDRAFLDAVTNRTIEIIKSKIYDYKASYTQFEILRRERIEQQLASYTNQQKMIQETEDFIERFRYKATKAVQVQSRIKQLEKVERIEIDETDSSNINITFPEAPRSGDIVIDVENLSKSYGQKEVLENIWFTVERGEKIAFVGKNGAGKTTLVRIIKDEIPYQGILKIGHNVKIGYYAQNQEKELNPEKTVFETLDDIAVGDIRTKLRDILGRFLFGNDDIHKKVEVLSGGERARLALAKLMLEPYNLLILDEPTNHLDMHSKDVLKNALLNYNGTIIVVSHDRDFLQGLSSKIFEFGDKNIKKHSGDIAHFLAKKKIDSFNEIERKLKAESEKTVNFSQNKEIYEERKKVEKEIRKFRKMLDDAENRIFELENFIENAEKRLSSGELIDDKKFYSEFDRAKTELDTKMHEWENFSKEIEILEQKKESIK